MLEPEDIWEASDIDAIDMAIKRTSEEDAPSDIEIAVVYLKNGEVHVAQMYQADLSPLWNRLQNRNWDYLGSLGPAVDVSIEWDGYWTLPQNKEGLWWVKGNPDTRWIKISEGEPWVFWITPEGELKAQEGMGGSTLSLANGEIESCRTVRSWKNIRHPDRDHGLIVAYIENGEVFYRNRCTQSDDSIIWESEKPGEEDDPLFDGTVTHVQPFRTNDYRTGFLAVVDGNTEWIFTERNWAGMAIPHERISASLTDFTADLIRIHYENISHEENITASLESLENWLLWASETEVQSAENIMTEWPVEGEELGEGDGTETVFPIDYEPIEDTETIYFDATAQDPETYTLHPVDHEEHGYSAEVEFNEAPPSNVLITADYEWENWGRRIRIVFEHGIRNPTGQDTHLDIEDDGNSSYSVYETYPEDTWYKVGQTPQHPDILDTMWQVMLLETADLNVSEGDITVIYDEAGGLLGEAEQDVSSFTFTFTPENLVILDLPVPEVEAIYNE